jgi:hypothetical protein
MALLALEFELLEAAGCEGDVLGIELQNALAEFGAMPAIAGMFLARFAQMGSEQSGLIWSAVPHAAKIDLAHVMLGLRAEIFVSALGGVLLHELLCQSRDPWIHEQIAVALRCCVVADSEKCLEAMMPSAKISLAMSLAERMGSDGLGVPAWFSSLAPADRRRASIIFAFGLLRGDKHDQFELFVRAFGAADWQMLGDLVRQRAYDLNAGSLGCYLTHRRTAVPFEVDSIRCGGPIHRPVDEGGRISGVAMLRRAENAAGHELAEIFVRSCQLSTPTWCREVLLSLLRRSLALDVRLPGLASKLSRTDLAAELAIFRLSEGDTSVLRRKSWGHVAVDRKFSVLRQVIAGLKGDDSLAGRQRYGDVAYAILQMPGVTRSVLSNFFISQVGQDYALSDVFLDLLGASASEEDDELFVALARGYALRGIKDKSQDALISAQQRADAKLRRDGLRRLACILEAPDALPGEPLAALFTSLAVLHDNDLNDALKLCQPRLPPKAFAVLVGNVIANGRATAALSPAFP